MLYMFADSIIFRFSGSQFDSDSFCYNSVLMFILLPYERDYLSANVFADLIIFRFTGSRFDLIHLGIIQL